MNDKLIMVVEREILFAQKYFQGFIPAEDFDYESLILNNFEWMKRSVVEQNPSYKQPVAYSAIINPFSQKIFVYQRAKKDEKYSEKRLQGKLSCGIGGHIEKQDIENRSPISASMLRELDEEVEIIGSKKPRIVGYINDDADSVGRVHFGLLYVVETDANAVKPKDAEIENGGLMKINDVGGLFAQPEVNIEGWTKISFEFLRKFF